MGLFIRKGSPHDQHRHTKKWRTMKAAQEMAALLREQRADAVEQRLLAEGESVRKARKAAEKIRKS